MRLVLPFAVAVFLLGFSMLYDGLASKDAVVDRSVGYAEGCDEGTVRNCSPLRTLQLRAAYLVAIQLPIREFQVGEGLLVGILLLLLAAPLTKLKPLFTSRHWKPVAVGGALVFSALMSINILREFSWAYSDAMQSIVLSFGNGTIFGIVTFGVLVSATAALMAMKSPWFAVFRFFFPIVAVFLAILLVVAPGDMPRQVANFTIPMAFGEIYLANNLAILIASSLATLGGWR